MQPAVIIPVYNHERYIAEVIGKTLLLGLPVIVVDDGSTDSTAENIAVLNAVRILHHATNKGKGAALLTGFNAAAEEGYDYAVTLDGDGQHNPEDIVKLLHAVSDAERCLVIGSRQGMDGRKNVPWTSRFGRRFSNFWVWVAGGPLVEDSQSGFRLYPLPEVLSLDVQARRYQFEVEVLVKAQQERIRIKEVPVQVIYQPKGERVSHFRPWVDFHRNSAVFSRLIRGRIFRLFGL